MLLAYITTSLPLLEVGDLILHLVISALVVVIGFGVFVTSTLRLFVDPIKRDNPEEAKARKKRQVKRLLTQMLIGLAMILAGGISCSYQG